MWTLATIVLGSLFVWLIWEAWRAPTYREKQDGSFEQTTPTKTFKDLLNSIKKLFRLK